MTTDRKSKINNPFMTQEDKDRLLREHLLYLLRGGGAHITFDKAVEEFPEGLINARPAGSPHTPWQVLEHLRIAQWDILEFSRDPAHVSPPWPEGYWPDPAHEADAAAWHASVEAFRRDLREMEELIADDSNDLYARIPHGTGQTLLREALLVADHNAYHLGALVTLRKTLESKV
jgi:DinB superfamily